MDDRTTLNKPESITGLNSKDFEIKTSRNGLPVPVIKGIHLHSVYNPAKEAEAFAEKYEETLKQNNYVLVLGLGFGYHIDQIEKSLSEKHEHFNILVLEPNKKIHEGFKTYRAFKNNSITILNTEDASELFESEQFINFLRQKPSIIKHDPSFNLEKKFYTDFLKYKAPTHLSQYTERLADIVQMYFAEFENLDMNIKDFISNIRETHGVRNRFDFGMLAFEQILLDQRNTKESRGN